MIKPRICLNMIVKNETPVLGRLFASVKDIISYYVIVDTGSTDGTPEFIKSWMDKQGIPGEIYIHEWINFGFNRDQALQYAYRSGQAEWVLIIDADEELGFSDAEFYRKLRPGVSYRLEKHHGTIRYGLNNLIDISQTRWRWRGVVHEYLESEGSPETEALNDAWIMFHEGEGARSRGLSFEEKFMRDAQLLENELKHNPADTRSRFYLAQSYRDARHYQQAYENYLIRAGMGGWLEESFVAQYQAGKIAVILQKPYGEIAVQLLKAYEMRPSRGAEPLHELAMYCRNQGWFVQAYLFAKSGSEIPYPTDILFVEKEVYEWKIFDELAVAAYWTGRYEESREACEKSLQFPLSAVNRERIQKNLQFALDKLGA